MLRFRFGTPFQGLETIQPLCESLSGATMRDFLFRGRVTNGSGCNRKHAPSDNSNAGSYERPIVSQGVLSKWFAKRAAEPLQ